MTDKQRKGESKKITDFDLSDPDQVHAYFEDLQSYLSEPNDTNAFMKAMKKDATEAKLFEGFPEKLHMTMLEIFLTMKKELTAWSSGENFEKKIDHVFGSHLQTIIQAVDITQLASQGDDVPRAYIEKNNLSIPEGKVLIRVAIKMICSTYAGYSDQGIGGILQILKNTWDTQGTGDQKGLRELFGDWDPFSSEADSNLKVSRFSDKTIRG